MGIPVAKEVTSGFWDSHQSRPTSASVNLLPANCRKPASTTMHATRALWALLHGRNAPACLNAPPNRHANGCRHGPLAVQRRTRIDEPVREAVDKHDEERLRHKEPDCGPDDRLEGGPCSLEDFDGRDPAAGCTLLINIESRGQAVHGCKAATSSLARGSEGFSTDDTPL